MSYIVLVTAVSGSRYPRPVFITKDIVQGNCQSQLSPTDDDAEDDEPGDYPE